MRKQHTGFNVRRGGINQGIALHPRAFYIDDVELNSALNVRRETVVVVIHVHPPASLELFKIIQAHRGIRSRFRAAQRGEQERGEHIIAEMDSNLARLAKERPSVPPTAIVLHANNFTFGRGSMIDEVVTRAGLENVAVRLGIGEYGQLPLEIITMNPVDVLIVSSYRDGPAAMATELLRHPVLSRLSDRMRVVVIPDRLWNCGGPALVEAVEILTRVAREVRGKVPPNVAN